MNTNPTCRTPKKENASGMNPYLLEYIKINFDEPGKALDLGAGNFSDVNFLHSLHWDAQGVDITQGIDLEKPYVSPESPYDLVYSCYLLHKLQNRNILIDTAQQNLKPGGKVFVHTFDASDKYSTSDISSDALYALLADGGFTNIAIRKIDYYDDEPGHNHWHIILEGTAEKPTIGDWDDDEVTS